MNAFRIPALTLLLTTVALAGCGAETAPIPPPTPADGATPDAAESVEALKVASSLLVGKYEERPLEPGPVAQLALRADGTFGATFHAAAIAIADPPSPFVVESGTWRATRRQGKLRLTLRAASATRTYEAARTGDRLVLVGEGATQSLAVVGDDRCWGDADCGSGEACGIQVCTMACLPGDPVCCGPRICLPKEPAPADECFGAWLDQSGVCRAPNDGVIAAKCCAEPPVAGDACGPVTCAKGTVCCNPLAGICTAPGDACTF